MVAASMPSIRIGDLEAPTPIIQGGMGVGISLAGLAAAVANEGGIGVIASVGIGKNEPDIHTDYSGAHKRALIREIQKARGKSNGIIGVNIMVALTDFDSHVEGAVEGGADIIFMGAGLPRKLPDSLPLDNLDALHTKFVPIISSGKAARIVLKYWRSKYNYTPAAVVVEGPLAGGHLGFKAEHLEEPEYQLESLVPEVLEAIKPFEDESGKTITVIAGGGVYSGADIRKFLELGAGGVQMATRFVATHECDADLAFKEAYVNCSQEDLMIIKSPVGIPGRAIRSPFLVKVESGSEVPYSCPWKCLQTCDVIHSPYCIAEALVKAKVGEFDQGFAFAGANAWRTKEIISVHELFEILNREYAEAVASAPVNSR